MDPCGPPHNRWVRPRKVNEYFRWPRSWERKLIKLFDVWDRTCQLTASWPPPCTVSQHLIMQEWDRAQKPFITACMGGCISYHKIVQAGYFLCVKALERPRQLWVVKRNMSNDFPAALVVGIRSAEAAAITPGISQLQSGCVKTVTAQSHFSYNINVNKYHLMTVFHLFFSGRNKNLNDRQLLTSKDIWTEFSILSTCCQACCQHFTSREPTV